MEIEMSEISNENNKHKNGIYTILNVSDPVY